MVDLGKTSALLFFAVSVCTPWDDSLQQRDRSEGKEKWEAFGVRSCTQTRSGKALVIDLSWFWGWSQSSSLMQALEPMYPQQHKQIPAGPARCSQKYPGRVAKITQKRTWNNPKLRRDPWENASPDADHCSLYEFTWLIFLIWWAKLLSADIQHPLMKLQVLSTF